MHGRQLRTASNAPGARPAQPRAPRSFTSPQLAGQKGSSEITYDPLILGYTCSPRDRPNALFPSKRTPPVRKYRSRNLKTFCRKNPALITRTLVSPASCTRAALTTGTPGPGNPSPYAVARPSSDVTACPPTEKVEASCGDSRRSMLPT